MYESSIDTRFFEELLIKFNLIIINEEGMSIKRLLKKNIYYRFNYYVA